MAYRLRKFRWVSRQRPRPAIIYNIRLAIDDFRIADIQGHGHSMSISDELRQAALEYHRLPRPGKIKVTPTTSLLTQRDLSLA